MIILPCFLLLYLAFYLGRVVEQGKFRSKNGRIDLYLMARQGGKTTMLIEMSAKTGKVIVAPSLDACFYIKRMADEMKIHIPCPIPFSDLVWGRNRGRGEEYIVDELGMVLNYYHISAATLDAGSISVHRED